MGAYYEFQCPGCKYEAEVSGREDFGYVTRTQTMICNDCHSLVDVTTQTRMEGMEGMVGKCPVCKSGAVATWDPVKQPCPKCGVSMKKGPLTAFWD